MSLIEESGLFKWATINKGKNFLPIDPIVQSYFEDFDIETPEIEGYDFKNIPELIHLIETHSSIENDEYAQLCAVEAFRNKPHVTETPVAGEGQVDLPDFVYVF